MVRRTYFCEIIIYLRTNQNKLNYSCFRHFVCFILYPPCFVCKKQTFYVQELFDEIVSYYLSN